VSVYTTDVLVEGIRRDDVLVWLSNPANHRAIVTGAFDGMSESGPGHYALELKSPPRPRTIDYSFDRVDEEHGGRRIHIKLAGRHVNGTLTYSLRTMKPSTNTLVTLHVDLFGNGYLLLVAEKLGLRPRLEKALADCAANVKRELLATKG
jgi:hypothetical protein